MKPSSFRFKIALFSALLTGGLLAGCGWLFWKVNYRIEMNRLDREVRNLGSANLDRIFGRDHWERFENALRFVGGEDTQRYLLLVRDEDGHEVYRSGGWPNDLDILSLPKPGPVDPSVRAELDPVNQLHRAPPRPGEPLSRDNPPLPRLQPVFVTRSGGGKFWRLGVMGNPRAALVIGVNLREVEAGMEELRAAFLLWMPIALVLVAGGGWLLARRALRPVSLLTQAVEGVNARDLSYRLTGGGYDTEFQRLIEVFNAMLERLESSFQQALRFTADAAHELRTPLTVLQGELEQSLQHASSGSPEQQRQVVLLDEVEQLKAIVEKLLLLSQADAGRLPLDLQRLDLSVMVAEVIGDSEILAEKQIRIEHQVAQGVMVAADQILIHQLLQNLATNALRYNCESGIVRFRLELREGRAVLTVANTGPGIPEAEQEKVFQRFHRVDPARSRREGIGLGLALSREIARAHGGDLKLLESAEGWTAFELSLAGATVDSR